jgi:hypothetical protein
MSELTPCNYCSLNRIKRRANEKGLQVTLLSSRGGFDVYVHPADVTVNRETVGDEEGKPSSYWGAWLMALTDHCVC